MADKNLSVPSKLISYHSDQSWNHQNACCIYCIVRFFLYLSVPSMLRSLFSMVKRDSKSTHLQFSLTQGIVSTGAAGAQTRRSLGHHLLHPLILRLLVLCAPAVLRPRALQDAPAPADPNS